MTTQGQKIHKLKDPTKTELKTKPLYTRGDYKT